MSESIKLSKISLDTATQSRESIDEGVVSEYAECLDELPPVDLYFDGTTYRIGDGWHRVLAAKQAGRQTIKAIVHNGGHKESLLHAVGANAQHGLRRSSADKRKCVRLMLATPEWATWSDREIARQCRVDHHTVARVRAELPSLGNSPVTAERTFTTKHGGTAVMDTSGIGRKASDSAPIAGPQDEFDPAADDAPPADAKPWSAFEARVREIIRDIKSCGHALHKVFEYDSEEKVMKCRWARAMTYAGSIDQLNQVIRNIEGALPVGIDAKGRVISAHQHKILEGVKRK